jgi:hypothetical protein
VQRRRGCETVSLLLSAIGGALIGWPTAVGGGVIVLGIPFAVVASNHLEDAVDAHNATTLRAAGADRRRALSFLELHSMQERMGQPSRDHAVTPLPRATSVPMYEAF